MAAAISLAIKQGESLQYTATRRDSAGVAVDLTGCEAETSIRQTYGSAVVGSGSTADGRITIDEPDGEVNVNLPPAVTELIEPGQYLSDLKVTYPSGVVEYFVDVQLEVQRRITE